MKTGILKYDNRLFKERVRRSTIDRTEIVDEFYSDRSRIIYSSSFRRLQQKAQVFSLEPNSSVRTRLTHSLEVSDLGRTLANRIAYQLSQKNLLSPNNILNIVSIVENACLLHDIGNPPFGHFGETAIRDWAKNRALKALPDLIDGDNEELQQLMNDFYEFDGNPQGFRTITKLHTEYDEFSLNLTYSTLLCALKYSRAAGEPKGEGILKKAGYFQSEKDLVENIYENLGITLHRRYPFTYIMEAADDIAYCMSDIADGIEKGILTTGVFLDHFKDTWEKSYPEEDLPAVVRKTIGESIDKISFNKNISVPWSKAAMNEAVENYMEREDDIYNGMSNSLIDTDKPMGRVLETVKKVSRKILYTSLEAEGIEITGYAVITGILQQYERLMKLSYEDFERLIRGNDVGNLEIERRLFNRVGKRYIEAYKYAVDTLDVHVKDYSVKEWWLRVHLLIDHISGMTDEYALETYQMFKGIRIMR